MPQNDSETIFGLREGQIVDGKYRVEGLLGIGGTGAVIAARHEQLGTKVAIKVLLPEMLGNREAVARFTREAQAAARIWSEHVVRVIDVGQMAGGAPYMVMEFLEGCDLAGRLEQRGPLALEQAVEFVLQVCLALAEAHRLGTVHRDLKPANLFCVQRSDGRLLIKVLDFGISKVLDANAAETDFAGTQAAAFMGSPLYMSPEQMQSSRDADPQSDIWSLGVTAYELLTGTTPFEGPTLAKIAVNAATLPPPPIRDLRPDVSLALQAAIFRCLEKDPRSRYQDVGELARALLPFAPARATAMVEQIVAIVDSTAPPPGEQHRVSASVAPVASEPPGLASITRWAWRARATSRPGRHAVAAVVLAGGAAIALAASIGPSAPRARSTSETPVASPEIAPTTTAPPAPATSAEMPSTAATPAATAASAPADASSLGAAPAQPKPRRSRSAPRTKPGCDPNFELDAKGRKHFKPECFENQ